MSKKMIHTDELSKVTEPNLDTNQASVIDTNNFVTRADVVPVQNDVIDITPMFEINTSVDFVAFMFNRNSDVNKPLIKLHGFNDSGSDNDLIITPAVGFGPQHISCHAIIETEDGTTFNTYAIKIEQDATSSQHSIIIPKECKSFDITYYLQNNVLNKASYYIGTDNIAYPFDLGNTPINVFSNSGNETTSILINGKQVVKNTIKEITFGESYNTVTDIRSASFLSTLPSLNYVDLTGLKNLATIDIRFSLAYCPSLNKIRLGDFDWSSVNISGGTSYTLVSVPNVSSSIIYADSQELADNFRAKVGGKLTNWTVITN